MCNSIPDLTDPAVQRLIAANPILELMVRHNVPLTRENYVEIANAGRPDDAWPNTRRRCHGSSRTTMNTDRDTGILYVLANRDSSLAKVGMTRNGTPIGRADDYARQHSIEWHVFWSIVTNNVADAEAAAHRALADRRFSLLPEAREVFHITPAHAARIAERFVIAAPGSGTPHISMPPSRLPWRHYAEIAVAAAAVAWPTLRQLQRLLRSARRV